MDDTAQILEQVKKAIAVSIPKDQAKLIDQLEREYKNIRVAPPTDSKPFITDGKQLIDPGIYQQFEDLAKEFIVTDNEEQALKARRFLEDILLPQNKSLKIQQPKLYEQYQKVLALFKYVCLPIRSLNEVDALIKSYLIFALRSGVNIEDKLDQVLFTNDDALNDASIALRLSRDMLACTEQLGKAELQIQYENKTARPLLGNWIKDYLSFSTGSENRSAFQRIGYVRRNKNALSLDPQEKELLLQTLKIYDWLEFGNYESNDDEAVNQAPGEVYINKQSLRLPTAVLKPQLIKQPPTVPLAPKPQLKVMDDVESKKPKQADAPKILPSIAPKPLMPEKGGRPVNIQDILKKRENDLPAGLRIGGEGNGIQSKPLSVISNPLPPQPSVPPSPQNKQADIDNKLKELEKRMKGKN